MRTTRLLAAAAVSAALIALPSGAMAATYPPADSNATASDTSPEVGDEVSVSAGDYQPNSDVDVKTTVAGSAAGAGSAVAGSGFRGSAVLVPAAGGCETGATCTVVADGSGTASASVTILEAGPTTVTFSGTGANGEPLVQSIELNAVAADDGTDPSDPDGTDPDGTDPDDEGGVLPDTGAEIATWTLTGLALVGLGAVVVIAARRRSHTEV